MAFRVEYSKSFEVELSCILERMAYEYDNFQAAERFNQNVYQKANILARNPHLYPLCLDERLFVKGYRYVMVGNYIMIYNIDEEKTLVKVKNILYGRRDIGSIVE